MANKFYLKPQPISLIQQKIRIFQLYSSLIDYIEIIDSELVCIINLQPSELSDKYKVKLTYKISDKAPKVWLLSPNMRMYNGKLPHHLYRKNGVDAEENYQLCVYDPWKKEWNQQQFIAESFIPWVCTWLNTYEYWLITGEWHYDEAFPHKNHPKQWEKK